MFGWWTRNGSKAKWRRALHFHHLDPNEKRFGLGSPGLAQAIDRLREEARKCVLRCANCHAEVEAGVATIPAAVPGTPPG